MEHVPESGAIGGLMSPSIVRHVLLPLHDGLLRRPTRAYQRDLARTQWLSRQKLEALQTQKLRRVLHHAQQSTSFYAARLREARVDVASFELSDLPRIRLLSKADIRESLDEMTALDVRGGVTEATTGGSTGEPLRFRMCRYRQAADQAARARTREWFGIAPGERELYLWGSPVELRASDFLRRCRDRLMNHVLLSAFELSAATMDRYLDRLAAWDPVHIFGYPSSLAAWARHAMSRGRSLRTPSLKAVFTTGEVLLPHDRRAIADAAGVPVADGYGSREGGFVAHQCPHGGYHIAMENLIVELLDDDEHPVGAECVGEIVLTHLDAIGMPLIRYKTGDLAAWDDAPCPCGRALARLRRIEGRSTDAVRREDGGSAHALSLIYVLRDAPGVRQFRISQRHDLSLDVDIVANPAFDMAQQQRAGALLARQIGSAVDVRFNPVARIPMCASGKHRYVVSQAM